MQPRRSIEAKSSGGGSSGAKSPALLFFALLGLIAIGGGVAWLVLSGSPTTPETAQRPVEPPATPAENAAPAVTDEPAEVPPVDPEEWEAQRDALKGTRLPMKGNETKDLGELGPTYPLSGKVVDDRSEEPVYFFSVWLIPIDRGDPMTAKNSWAPSRFRNGEFHIERQPAGIYNLIVESREHEPVTRQIQVPYEGRVEVKLHHGNCIRGIVRDAMQTPLKDIEVHLVVDLARLDKVNGAAPPMPLPLQTKTDDMGRFSFWKLPPGNYALRVAMSGDVLKEEPEFRLDQGGEVLRDFTLERFGTLKLTVTNIAEQPVARARVTLLQDRDGRDRPVRTGYSDLKGVARLEFVREGSYKLRVDLQGFERYEQPVAVAGGERFREVPVQLQVAAKPPR